MDWHLVQQDALAGQPGVGLPIARYGAQPHAPDTALRAMVHVQAEQHSIIAVRIDAQQFQCEATAGQRLDIALVISSEQLQLPAAVPWVAVAGATHEATDACGEVGQLASDTE